MAAERNTFSNSPYRTISPLIRASSIAAHPCPRQRAFRRLPCWGYQPSTSVCKVLVGRLVQLVHHMPRTAGAAPSPGSNRQANRPSSLPTRTVKLGRLRVAGASLAVLHRTRLLHHQRPPRMQRLPLLASPSSIPTTSAQAIRYRRRGRSSSFRPHLPLCAGRGHRGPQQATEELHRAKTTRPAPFLRAAGSLQTQRRRWRCRSRTMRTRRCPGR